MHPYRSYSFFRKSPPSKKQDVLVGSWKQPCSCPARNTTDEYCSMHIHPSFLRIPRSQKQRFRTVSLVFMSVPCQQCILSVWQNAHPSSHSCTKYFRVQKQSFLSIVARTLFRDLQEAHFAGSAVYPSSISFRLRGMGAVRSIIFVVCIAYVLVCAQKEAIRMSTAVLGGHRVSL